MTVEEFENAVWTHALASTICLIPHVRRSSTTALNLRVPLATGEFIDVFYNEISGTVAYALIKDRRRIYGADNTDGWHFHPFDDPHQHIPLLQPLTFAEFLTAVEEFVKNR